MSNTSSTSINVNNVISVLNSGGGAIYPSNTSRMSFNDYYVRYLAGRSSGRISMNDMRNKPGPTASGTVLSSYCSGSTLVQSIADGKYGSTTNNIANSPACGIIASLTISSNTTNYTLNTGKVSGYIAGRTRVTLTINSGVYVYSTSTFTPALTVTGFAAGDVINIINNGFIVGMGGAGASAPPRDTGARNGAAGGPAFRTTVALSLTNNGTIGGGGGGGGASAGYSQAYAQGAAGAPGGGGRALGPAGVPERYEKAATAGTLTAPGSGAAYNGDVGNPNGPGGNGGNLGQVGGNSGSTAGRAPGLGGEAGAAIVGNSLITYSVRGNILGAYT